MSGEHLPVRYRELQVEYDTLGREFMHWVGIRDAAQDNLKRINERKAAIQSEQVDVLREVNKP